MSEPAQPRILVVDDETGMLRAISRVLQGDYQVKTCDDPLQARHVASSFCPDIAVLDIRMPGLDGFRLMRQLLQDDPGLDVILMTGNFDEADADLVQAIENGAFFYLQKPVDRRVMLALVSRCVERRSLQQAKAQHARRIESELQDAERFQLAMLPQLSQLQHGVAINALFQSCSELAGDFFDYAFLGAGDVILLVADVSGHGVGAAMMTGTIKVAFQAAVAARQEPQAVIERIHRSLVALEDDRKFVTAFCAQITGGERNQISYFNAGHPPAILATQDELQLLSPTAPLISPAFPAEAYRGVTNKIDVSLSQRMLIYTDGVLDVGNSGDRFGIQRLVAWVQSQSLRGQPLLEALSCELDRFAIGAVREDDITAMTVHFES